jgi:hypothetical protein
MFLEPTWRESQALWTRGRLLVPVVSWTSRLDGDMRQHAVDRVADLVGHTSALAE